MTGVWIVILNFNDAQSTASCISSLRRHLTLPELKVVVVDNGSDTSRVSAVEQGYPPVTLVWTGKNLGFAGGVNFALKRILAHGPKYVMLLNNDVIVTEDFLSPLLHYMNDNPRVAVVGPIVVDLESGTIQSAGLWLSRFLLQTRNPFFHADRNMISSNREPMAVDYVSGCAMLV